MMISQWMWGDDMSNEYDDAGNIVATPEDKRKAKRKAKNKSKRAQMKGWEADLKVLGNPEIKSKQTATLEKCGNILNGDWRISSVRHEISSSGYICSLKLIRPDSDYAEENTVESTPGDNSDNYDNSNNASSNNGDDDITVNVG